ncbi:MAG: TPMT family class I SAM-dependent methyltransferase [Burkholderiales bacterium]|nr:TPMT family class I SAM-dependent methyltransferase [Burkholderiales bacterium]
MAKQDASAPEFWDKRYGERFMPWDAGGVPAALAAFLAQERRPLRVLVPGCGSAYEARAFAAAGHDVLAIDFSAQAIDLAREVLGPHAGVLRLADFFAFDPGAPFDLVYERAFLCALPRSVWPRYAPRLAKLVVPGGRLAGFFFWSDEVRGPPFGLAPGELERLLMPWFERIEDKPVADSIPVFAGRERWQVWRRAV